MYLIKAKITDSELRNKATSLVLQWIEKDNASQSIKRLPLIESCIYFEGRNSVSENLDFLLKVIEKGCSD
jgi:hypothetical protein